MSSRVWAGIAILILAAIGYWKAYDSGYSAAVAKNQQASLDGLISLIQSSTSLINKANDASQSLSSVIAARQQADEKTTRNLRETLEATKDLRAACVYSADVLRDVRDARSRAAAAVTGGISRTVPAASGHDE